MAWVGSPRSFLAGTATDDGATKVDLTNLNSPEVNAGGVGLCTPQWGAAARTRTVDGLATVREVILRDGVVVSSATTPGTTLLAGNELVLIGREAVRPVRRTGRRSAGSPRSPSPARPAQTAVLGRDHASLGSCRRCAADAPLRIVRSWRPSTVHIQSCGAAQASRPMSSR